MKWRIAVIAVLAIAASSLPLEAHHSFSMFDHEKKITVSGTLKEFEWTNPHCWLHIAAPDPATGKIVEWAFEMGSIGQIAQQGWKIDSVKAGDKVTVEAYPLKDGSHGGQYLAAKLEDGRSFKQ